MNIVDAYRRTGSYRAAAAICGVNHKTVRRVVERAGRGRFERAAAPRRLRNTDVVLGLIEERVRQTDGRISAKRLLPEARAAGTRARPATCAVRWHGSRSPGTGGGACSGHGCPNPASTW
jgi:hypothetical protein